jgi:hypothetical protein
MTGDYINKQREEERKNAIDTDSGSWLNPFTAGIGAIGIGSFLLKKRVAEGGEYLSNMFNFLGMPKGIGLSTDAAANAGKSEARGGTSGLRSLLSSSYDVNKNQLNLGPIDLIDDVRNALDIIASQDERHIAELLAEKTTEFINREFSTGGNNTGFFTQGLERVTVKKVLEDQKAWSRVLGAEQVGVLEKAEAQGLIGNNNVIDKKIFFNPNTREAIDFRARNLFTKLETLPGKGGPEFARVPRLDLFGQARVVRSGLPSKRGVAVVGPGSGEQGSRLFIGGDLFQVRKTAEGASQLTRVGRDVSLRRAGTPLEAIAASRQGRLTIKQSGRKGIFGGALNFLENNLGVGPGFATRRPLLARLILDPLKRARALQTGEGIVFKSQFRDIGSSKLGESVFGAQMPEMLSASGRLAKIEGYTGRAQNIQSLGFLERLKVLFNVSNEYNVVRTSQYNRFVKGNKSNIIGKDLVVPTSSKGYSISGSTIPAGSSVNEFGDVIKGQLTAAGQPTTSSRYGYYASEKVGGSAGLSSARDFAAYSLYRINSLASEFLGGIGMRPDHRILPNLARLSAIPVIYETIRQTALYADYVTEKATGISPIKGAASLYATARQFQQGIREATGIQQGAAFLEEYFPGSIESEGSTLLRSIVAPLSAASILLGKGAFRGALGAAAGVYGVIGGPAPGQTSEDLAREYSGEKKVPYRKGALWGLGYTPFFGGRPEYYGQGWYAKLMSGYRDKSLYGTEEEYWGYHANVFGIPLPTPSNLFGVLNVLNPYRLEERQYEDRPYMVTGNKLNAFPIFGPILGATIGELMKPTTYRQPDELPLLKAGLASEGLTPSMAQSMGIPGINATAYEADDPSNILKMVQRQANIATEPLGVYKFAMEFFGISTKPDLGTELARSDIIDDIGSRLYDLPIGGLFGQTEFIRRFLLSDYSSQYARAAAINPIRNRMPDFLPGAYSESQADRNYFIDFTMGDPYSKIKGGAARLPGAGYEALNQLYSGVPGEYSDVDKFLILADVAPYSAAYKEYEARVLATDLDETWSGKVEEAITQRREVVGVDTRYKRYEDDIIDMNLSVFEEAAYAPIRKAYDFLTHDILAEIPVLGTKLFPFRDPYEEYRKTRVEGAEYASWERPYEGIVRPAMYDIALEDPLTAGMKGAVIGLLASGPMKWFNPIRSIAGGPGASWYGAPSTAMFGAAGAAGLSTARISAGYTQEMIPFHVQQENEALEYMDKIKYIKGRITEEAGGSTLDSYRTLVGARSEIQYKTALPTSTDRRYFDYFAQQVRQAGGSQIQQGLPDFMSQGLYMTSNQDFNTIDEAEAETSEFIQNNMLPSSDWIGWNPQVSPQATQLKLINHGINGISDDMHRFGFFESHAVDLKTRLSDFNAQEITFNQSPIHQSFDSFIKDQTTNIKNATYNVQSFSTPYRSKRELRIIQNRDQEFLNQLRYR